MASRQHLQIAWTIALCFMYAGKSAMGSQPVPTAKEFRSKAQAVIEGARTEHEKSRAYRFLRLTGKRNWHYRGSSGKNRTHRDAFSYETTKTDPKLIKFVSGRYLPANMLLQQDQEIVDEIHELMEFVQEDHTTIVARQRQAELRLQEEIERQQLLERELLLREQLRQERVQEEMSRIFWNQERAALNDIAEALPNEYGDSVPRLNVEFGIYRGIRGLVIEEAHRNGLGHRKGLRPGDRILRVNGQLINSAAEYRAASLSSEGALELLVENPNRPTRVVPIVAPRKHEHDHRHHTYWRNHRGSRHPLPKSRFLPASHAHH